MTHHVELQKWALHQEGENGRYVLTGFVYGHPKAINGEYVTTTGVKEIDFGAKLARTKNTTYILGGPANERGLL